MIARKPLVRLYEKDPKSGNYHFLAQTKPAEVAKASIFDKFSGIDIKGQHNRDSNDNHTNPTFNQPLTVTYVPMTHHIASLNLHTHIHKKKF